MAQNSPNYPIVAEIAHRTYGIDEFGMVSFYVLVGRDRGLVIDCGAGSFNARELVEKLCPLPYDVVITHAHGDHCGAMGLWDEVWMHQREIDTIPGNIPRMFEMLEENPANWKSAKQRGIRIQMPDGSDWSYPMDDRGGSGLYDFDNIRFMGFDKIPKLIPLEEGKVFDLGGGRKVETLHTPGHGLGHCVFIDPTARILFSGDACNYNCGMGNASVNTGLRNFLKIAAHREKFDRNYNGHMGPAADLGLFSMPESVLDDCIWICRSVLAGTAKIEKVNRGVRVGWAVRHGSVQMGVDPERLFDPGEEPAE